MSLETITRLKDKNVVEDTAPRFPRPSDTLVTGGVDGLRGVQGTDQGDPLTYRLTYTNDPLLSYCDVERVGDFWVEFLVEKVLWQEFGRTEGVGDGLYRKGRGPGVPEDTRRESTQREQGTGNKVGTTRGMPQETLSSRQTLRRPCLVLNSDFQRLSLVVVGSSRGPFRRTTKGWFKVFFVPLSTGPSSLVRRKDGTPLTT